jgi:glycosyltransferase involved in cell wall biosynthesis
MAGALPLVTVAMPAFNAAETLPEALRSVLAQNYRQLEIIVSDNHSSDETVKLVQRELAGHGVRVVTCPVAPRNGSYADTMPVIDNLNSLLGLGSGKYLAIYHADDVSNI